MSKMKIGSIVFTVILIFVVVSSPVSAAVVFEDDFNDGDLNGWRNGSGGKVTTSNTTPTYDSYYAKMTGESGNDVWIKRININTSGYKNIQLSCHIRTDFQLSDNDHQDKFWIGWQGTTGSFKRLETMNGSSEWTYKTWNLPEAGDTKIKIRFKMHNCEAADFACVDDVLVTGTPTGDSIPEFSTIAIPAVAILGLFTFYRRKQKK